MALAFAIAALALPASAVAQDRAFVNNLGGVTVLGDAGANQLELEGGAFDSSGNNYATHLWDHTQSIAPGGGCLPSSDAGFDDGGVICGNHTVNDLYADGGEGDDTITRHAPYYGGGQPEPDQVIITGGAGADTIVAYGGGMIEPGARFTLSGDAGNDTVSDSEDVGKIFGGPGSDTLSGNNGNDVMHGGDGNDRVYGEGDDDKAFGDAGNDTVDGGADNDAVTGGKGRDTLLGDGDTVYPGNDKIYAVDGKRDTVSCYFGADVAFVDQFDAVERHQCEQVHRHHVGRRRQPTG